MFKFAFALGIATEWLLGAPVHSPASLGYASLRAFMFTLLAWMMLETARMLVHAVQTLDDRP